MGLYGTYMATPQLAFRGRVDWLSLNYDDYDGRLINWMASGRLAVHQELSVAGVGYRYVDYKVGVTKSDFNGQVDYNFKGPTIFVNLGLLTRPRGAHALG